jgi:hypothetical protein
MAIQPQDARVLEFTDYVLESYIKHDADYPPEIWAEYLSSTLRTTNNCESFHRKLNSSFNSSHPNIFNFVEILKNIQSDAYIALRSQGTRNRRMIEKEEYIKKKMEELETKKITQIEFVRQLSFKFLPTSI